MGECEALDDIACRNVFFISFDGSVLKLKLY